MCEANGLCEPWVSMIVKSEGEVRRGRSGTSRRPSLISADLEPRKRVTVTFPRFPKPILGFALFSVGFSPYELKRRRVGHLFGLLVDNDSIKGLLPAPAPLQSSSWRKEAPFTPLANPSHLHPVKNILYPPFIILNRLMGLRSCRHRSRAVIWFWNLMLADAFCPTLESVMMCDVRSNTLSPPLPPAILIRSVLFLSFSSLAALDGACRNIVRSQIVIR